MRLNPISLCYGLLLVLSIFSMVISDSTVFSQKSPGEYISDDPIQIAFANTMLILGFIAALGTAIGIIVGLVMWLKKTVTKTTQDFILRQTEELKQSKSDTKENLQQIEKNLCNQNQNVINIVNDRFNQHTSSFNDLKRIVENVDDKIDRNREANIRHESLLSEHDRRLSNLENRFSNGHV